MSVTSANSLQTRRLNGSSADRPGLIVFADDWGRHPSSCQHLIRRLQPHYRILWVNSIGTRQVRANAFTLRRGFEKVRNWSRGLQQVGEAMWVLDAPMLPWIGNPVAKRLNRQVVTRSIRRCLRTTGIHEPVVMTTLPHVAWLLGDVGERGTVYYCTDDYSHWPSADRESLLAAEGALVARSDLVLAVSHKLVQRFEGHHRCCYFPHAVDAAHFRSSAEMAAHARLRELPGPRIGFFGLIYEKLNFELLTAVARRFPEASLVMIGPVNYCPESFAALPNVHLVGPQPYADIPQWIAGLDVLLLPYVLDEMILQSNPLKLRECLASGKPTVAVEVPEARRFEPHVRVASTLDEFVNAVGTALHAPESAATIAARQQAVAGESWDSRAAELMDHLQSLPHSKAELSLCPSC